MMTGKMAGVASLAAAFVAGMLVATALIGGTSGAAAQSQQFSVQRSFVSPTPATGTTTTPAAQQSAAQQQQVIVQKGVITPTVTDEDIELLRHDLRDRKRQVIGENMSLSDEEGEKFWPIYQHYVRDLTAVNDQKYALLKQYAEMWETMSDQDALIYVRHWLEVDGQAQALRLKYVPVVSQVLPGRKAATFFQLDRRLNMIVDLQLFGQIPLAHVKN
jgi:hypothetical protein